MRSVRLMSGMASVGGVVVLASAASAVPVTTWDYLDARLQYLRNDDGTFWADYDASNDPHLAPDVAGTAVPNGMKLTAGNADNFVFGVTGNTYIPTPPAPDAGGNVRGNRLIIEGVGTIDGAQWQHPDDIIRTTFDFSFFFTGGDIELYTIESSYTVFDAQGGFVAGVGSGTGFGDVFAPGNHEFNGITFEDRFGPINQPSDISAAVSIQWHVAIYFDWNNYSGGDIFNFSIPQNSIDIQAERIPAPGSAGLLGLAGVAALRRRR